MPIFGKVCVQDSGVFRSTAFVDVKQWCVDEDGEQSCQAMTGGDRRGHVPYFMVHILFDGAPISQKRLRIFSQKRLTSERQSRETFKIGFAK